MKKQEALFYLVLIVVVLLFTLFYLTKVSHRLLEGFTNTVDSQYTAYETAILTPNQIQMVRRIEDLNNAIEVLPKISFDYTNFKIPTFYRANSFWNRNYPHGIFMDPRLDIFRVKNDVGRQSCAGEATTVTVTTRDTGWPNYTPLQSYTTWDINYNAVNQNNSYGTNVCNLVEVTPKVLAFLMEGTELDMFVDWIAAMYEDIVEAKDYRIGAKGENKYNLLTPAAMEKGDIQRNGYLARKKASFERYKNNSTLVIAAQQAMDDNLKQILDLNTNLTADQKKTLQDKFDAKKLKIQEDMKKMAGITDLSGSKLTIKMEDVADRLKIYMSELQSEFPSVATNLNIPAPVLTVATKTGDFALAQIQDTAKDVAQKLLTKAGREALKKGIKIAKLFTPQGLIFGLANELMKWIIKLQEQKSNERKVCPLGYSDAGETERIRPEIDLIGVLGTGGEAVTVISDVINNLTQELPGMDMAQGIIDALNKQPQYCIGYKDVNGEVVLDKVEKTYCRGQRHVYSCYGYSADQAWKNNLKSGIRSKYLDEDKLNNLVEDKELLLYVRPFTYQRILDMCAKFYYEYSMSRPLTYYYTINSVQFLRYYTGNILQIQIKQDKFDKQTKQKLGDNLGTNLFFLLEDVNFAPPSLVPTDDGRVRKSQWDILGEIGATGKCEKKGLDYYVLSGRISGYPRVQALLKWGVPSDLLGYTSSFPTRLAFLQENTYSPYNRTTNFSGGATYPSQMGLLPQETLNYTPKITDRTPAGKCARPFKGVDAKQVWSQTNTTEMSGKNQGVEFDVRCKNGYITKFNVGESDKINSIQAECSDGEILQGVGKGGNTTEVTTRDGFNRLNVKSGELIDSVEFVSNDQVISKEGGTGGSIATTLDCQFGKIIGLRGTIDDNLRQLSAVCGGITLSNMYGLNILLGLYGLPNTQINVTDTLRARVKNNILSIPEVTDGAMGISFDTPPSNVSQSESSMLKYLNLPADAPLRNLPLRLWIVYSYNGVKYRVSVPQGKPIEIKGEPSPIDMTRERFTYQRISPRINRSQVLDSYPSSGYKPGLWDYDVNSANQLITHTDEGALAFNMPDIDYSTAPYVLTVNTSTTPNSLIAIQPTFTTGIIQNERVTSESNRSLVMDYYDSTLRVVLYDIGRDEQKMTYNPVDKTLKFDKTNRFLTVQNAGTSAGTLIFANTIPAGTAPASNQKWTYTENKQFKPDHAPTMCLTCGIRLSQLTLQPCDITNPGQIWNGINSISSSSDTRPTDVIETRLICVSGTAPNLVVKPAYPINGGACTAPGLTDLGKPFTKNVYKRTMNLTDSQKWTYNRKNQFVLTANPSLCLTAGPTPRVNTSLTVQACNDSNLGQIWEMPRNDQVVLNPNDISRSGSLLFNRYLGGSGLEYVSDDGFNIGTGTFTLEWWQFQTGSAYPRIFSIGNHPTALFAGETGNGYFIVWVNGNGNYLKYPLTGPYNIWLHIAIVGDGAKNIRFYVNGTLTSPNATNYSTTTGYNLTQGAGKIPLMIGNQSIRGGDDTAFVGLITNFHFVKGQALYTSNFTPSNKPIAPTANTELLLLANTDDPLKDSSGKNRVATNYNVSYSSQSPFP